MEGEDSGFGTREGLGYGLDLPEGSWRVTQVVESASDAPGFSVWPDRARVGLPGMGEIRIDRGTRSIHFSVRRRMSAAELRHPGLAPVAAVVAYWEARIVLHGAAVVVGSGAWGILAPQGGGKSTTATLLIRAGATLLTDDLLVIGTQGAAAGPGSVDLREDAGRVLGGEPLGILGSRERWRQRHAVEPRHVPMAGWLLLEAGEAVTVQRLGAGNALRALVAQSVIPPADAAALLDLGALPSLKVTRTASLGDGAALADAVLTAIRDVDGG